MVVLDSAPTPWDTGEAPGLATKGRDVKLTHIAITNWRNFAHIEFDLSSRLSSSAPTPQERPTFSAHCDSWVILGAVGSWLLRRIWVAQTDTFVLARILPLSSRRSTIPRTRRNSLCFFG